MLKPFWVDLHIHTALSPCGSLDMGAPEIVSAARGAGIDVIGIADHNTCDNFPAVHEASEEILLSSPALKPRVQKIFIFLLFFLISKPQLYTKPGSGKRCCR